MNVDLRAEVDRLQEALKWAVIDKENAQADVAAKNRELGGVRAELTKQRQNSPEAAGVRDVFDHWVKVLGKDPSRQKPDSKLGEKRQAKIRARLREGFTVDELKRAIDGLARRPFVGPKGRMAQGSQSQRFDDLTTALADETTVPRFIGYAETEPESNVVELVPSPKGVTRDPWHRPLDRAVAALRREFGSDAVRGEWGDHEFRADCWWSVCPVQPGLGQPMRLQEKGGVPGGSLIAACAHGCLPSALMDAIRRLEAKAASERVSVVRKIDVPEAAA